MAALHFEEKDDTLVVCITDAKILDETTIHEISQGLMECVERAASVGKRMAVDFRNVQFISSAMIGRLLLLNKAVRAAQTELWLCNVSPNVMQVFRVTRLDKVFRFRAGDDPETVEAFGVTPNRQPAQGEHVARHGADIPSR